ncbi:MAG TPA: hypothetical protein VG778_07200 [Blastocatellia bacterium]|nr:hypothetical protein [Blastocatellia bacterium]
MKIRTPLSFVRSSKKYFELIQVQLAAQELARFIPKGDTFIVVDQDEVVLTGIR